MNIRRQCQILIFFLLIIPMTSPGTSFCGDLDAPASPTDTASAMYTLEDLHNLLRTGTMGVKRPGPFTEPTHSPQNTMHTLTQITDAAPHVDNVNGATPGDVAKGKTFWGLNKADNTWGLQTGTKEPNVAVTCGKGTSKGDVEITSSAQLKNLTGYSSVDGNLRITGPEVTTLEGLECLETITGNLLIDFTRVITLNSLRNLKNVKGNLTIYSNSELCNGAALDFANQPTVGGTKVVASQKNCH